MKGDMALSGYHCFARRRNEHVRCLLTGRLGQMDDATLDGRSCRLSSVFHIQLVQDAFYVVLHGVFGNI